MSRSESTVFLSHPRVTTPILGGGPGRAAAPAPETGAGASPAPGAVTVADTGKTGSSRLLRLRRLIA